MPGLPRPQVSVYDVKDQREALRELGRLAREATVHPDIVRAARTLTADCTARDDLCELEAIFNAVKYGDARVRGLERGMRYVSDSRYADFFTGPTRMLSECVRGACGGDCLPVDTLVITKGFRLVPIGMLAVGDSIMGDGDWTAVTNVWDKGTREIIEVELNNGCVLRCTPEHKVFRVPSWGKKRTPASRRGEAEEIKAGALRIGDDLLTPSQLPTVRPNVEEREGATDSRPFAKVKVIRAGGKAPVVDIETGSHRFYLPESDLIVHNCDDQAGLVAALAGAVGFKTALRAWGKERGVFSHVYAIAYSPKREGKGNLGDAMGLDTTVPASYVGWQPSPGWALDEWVTR